VDGYKNGNNPDGPTITDHSALEALAAEVGGNLRIYSPREQPYSECAVVAAAASVIASRSESNLAAAPDPEMFSYFNSAFDLVNVAALRAEENYEQLLVGDLVQTWFLRGGVEPVEGYAGVAGSVTYVDTVAGTITFKPLQSGEAPPITLPSEFLVSLKSQRDLVKPFTQPKRSKGRWLSSPETALSARATSRSHMTSSW